jgi:hypothetical protein
MEKFIQQNVEIIELSGEDILRMCDDGVTIREYRDLAKFTSIEEVFGNKRGAVILYETREKFGHWVLLLKIGSNTVEFFDPLGIPLDQELGFIPDYYRKMLDEEIPHLTHLLANVDVVSNTTQLQEVDHEINTCGRHVVSRYRFFVLGYTLHRYVNLYKNQKESPDDTVSKITLFL